MKNKILSEKMKNKIKEYFPYALVILAIILPWFFRSGYLFLTDMVWGPKIALDWTSAAFLFNLLVKGLSFVLPIPFLEKVFITAVLAIVLLGGRLLVKTVLEYDRAGGGSANGLVFVLALFALFNPFVYDRALYGQFGILLAYGLLLFTVAYLFKTWQTLDLKNLRWAAVFNAVAFLFSAHFIFLLAPFYLLFAIGLYGKRREIKAGDGGKKFLLSLLFYLLIVAVLNANWLIALFVKTSPLTNFVEQGITNQDLVAFATAGKNGAEALRNVLLMSGFWGKDQFRYLDLTTTPGWQRSFILLAPLILFGVYRGFRRPGRGVKIFSAALLAIFVAAVVLAVGIKSGLTRNFVMFLYDHLPLYKGLREPQKWVAAIIPIYLFFLTLGVARLAKVKAVANNRIIGGLLIAAVIVMQAPSLLWGFNRQVWSTPYPDDWYQVNKLLLNQGAPSHECSDRILFLPWHMYMSFNWVGKIIANPAASFFACPVLSGTDMEWGGIYDNSTDPNGDAVAAWLAAHGKGGAPALSGSPVRYIVLAKELDYASYLWIKDLPYVKPLLETRTLLVYEVKAQ
jgi:hypothetical protein